MQFAVYQNPAVSAALTANSLRPKKSTFLWLLSVSTASAYAILKFVLRCENKSVCAMCACVVACDRHVFLFI